MKSKIFKIFIVFFILLIVLILTTFGFLSIRFPKKYLNEIKTYSSKYNLEFELVQSVIKVESGYNKNAISSQGAIGLMQILPSTAEEIANKLEIQNFNESMLKNPQVNIQFGCYYLRYLLDYYEGNVNNMLCAYNAGLSNVNLWLKDSKLSSNGKDLDEIPFIETRGYIKKINRAIKIYKIL